MGGTVDLKPFIYIYDLPPEYNQAFKQLPAMWHSEQYDCAPPCQAPVCMETMQRVERGNDTHPSQYGHNCQKVHLFN